jgi:hypothetical protein
MKNLLQLLLAIIIFSNCSSSKHTNSLAIEFKNKPNLSGQYSSYKIDNSFNREQNILTFIKQKGDFIIERGSDPEDINILNWYGEFSLKSNFRESPRVFLNDMEILSPNNNSLYNIRDKTVEEFDEIFITKGQQREIYLYTKK